MSYPVQCAFAKCGDQCQNVDIFKRVSELCAKNRWYFDTPIICPFNEVNPKTQEKIEIFCKYAVYKKPKIYRICVGDVVIAEFSDAEDYEAEKKVHEKMTDLKNCMVIEVS